MSAFHRRPRAGQRADEWFKSTYRPWRRRARIRFAAASPVLVLVVVPLVVIWPSWWEFFCGAVLGMAIATYECLIDAPPEWIERKRRGRDGERRTERQLRPLERRGWHMFHDLDRGRSNLDHVAAGPGGVFLLETKNLGGTAEIVDGCLTVKRGDDDRDTWTPSPPICNFVRRAAVAVRDELLLPANIRWVQGIVVLWCEFPAGVVKADNVVYVHGDRLRSWLETQPAALSPDRLRRAIERLEELQASGLEARPRAAA